jgi:hypothetical protein
VPIDWVFVDGEACADDAVPIPITPPAKRKSVRTPSIGGSSGGGSGGRQSSLARIFSLNKSPSTPPQ